MGVLELLSPEIVKIPMKSQTKREIIGELIQVLEDAGKLTDVEQARDAVLTREDMGSTGLEMGIAVPHAKTDAVKDLTMSLGIAPSGVEFQAQETPGMFRCVGDDLLRIRPECDRTDETDLDALGPSQFHDLAADAC